MRAVGATVAGAAAARQARFSAAGDAGAALRAAPGARVEVAYGGRRHAMGAVDDDVAAQGGAARAYRQPAGRYGSASAQESANASDDGSDGDARAAPGFDRRVDDDDDDGGGGGGGGGGVAAIYDDDDDDDDALGRVLQADHLRADYGSDSHGARGAAQDAQTHARRYPGLDDVDVDAIEAPVSVERDSGRVDARDVLWQRSAPLGADSAHASDVAGRPAAGGAGGAGRAGTLRGASRAHAQAQAASLASTSMDGLVESVAAALAGDTGAAHLERSLSGSSIGAAGGAEIGVLSPQSSRDEAAVFCTMMENRLAAQVEEITVKLAENDLSGVRWRWTVFRHMLNKYREAVATRITKIEEEIRGRENAQAHVSEAMREIERDMDVLTNEQRTLKNSRSELQRQLEEAETALGQRIAQLHRAEEQLQQITNENGALKQRNETLRKGGKKHEQRAQQLTQQVAALEQRMGELTQQLDAERAARELAAQRKVASAAAATAAAAVAAASAVHEQPQPHTQQPQPQQQQQVFSYSDVTSIQQIVQRLLPADTLSKRTSAAAAVEMLRIKTVEGEMCSRQFLLLMQQLDEEKHALRTEIRRRGAAVPSDLDSPADDDGTEASAAVPLHAERPAPRALALNLAFGAASTPASRRSVTIAARQPQSPV